MGAKLLSVCVIVIACCLDSILVQGSFIKGKNVPRVGRSNEADAFGSNDHEMTYVIKTMPSKNIPRMGRRNYGLENRYDIPKLYDFPVESVEDYQDDDFNEDDFYKQQLVALFEGKNMEKEK